MTTFNLEYTDTFWGEANYCWVRRASFILPEDSAPEYPSCALFAKRVERRIKRMAKKAIGLSGVRGEWESNGFDYEFRPRGSCTVLFVNEAE